MKNKILTLLATAAIFAASPVFAMENNDVSNIPAKKKFAVLKDADLKVDSSLNWHPEIGEEQPLKREKLFSFEIKDAEEKNGFAAFPVSWENVQYYTSDFDGVGNGGVYPWNCLAGNAEIKRYRVVEFFEGVVCVDTNKEPLDIKIKKYTAPSVYNELSVINNEHIYYSADIYKALPRSKTLCFHDSSGAKGSWPLDGKQQDFSYESLVQKEIAMVHKENRQERHELECQEEVAYQMERTNRRNELIVLVQEALANK